MFVALLNQIHTRSILRFLGENKMKKIALWSLLGLMYAASGCVDNTGYKTFDYPTTLEYTPTEFREDLGENVNLIETCNGYDGGNLLPYYDRMSGHWNNFYCLEKCDALGSSKSRCAGYGYKHFSPALDRPASCAYIDDCSVDVNIIYQCMELDGNQVFAPIEFQLCDGVCNASKTECN